MSNDTRHHTQRSTYLLAALDEIERGDESVGGSAREDTTEDASTVVLARVELDGVGVDLRDTAGSLCSSEETVSAVVRDDPREIRKPRTSLDSSLGSSELVAGLL